MKVHDITHPPKVRCSKNSNENLKHQQGEFKCDVCDHQYTSRRSLNRHLKNVHNEKIPDLPPRGRYSNINEKVLKHKRIFECDMCDKIYTEKRNLDHHRKRVHYVTTDVPVGEFKCQQCDKQFVKRHTLKYHMDKIHSISLPALPPGVRSKSCDKFTCEMCHNSYSIKRT